MTKMAVSSSNPIIYLDQNKWIELSQVYYGKNGMDDAISIHDIKKCKNEGFVFPLSCFHFMEFSRISNNDRRKRLGSVMWDVSEGITLACVKDIVELEIENSLRSLGLIKTQPKTFELLGKGIDFAFGYRINSQMPDIFQSTMNEGMLKGSELFNIPPISHDSIIHRENFKSHLESLQKNKLQVEKKKWGDWMYAISLLDIIKPLETVLINHNLTYQYFRSLDKKQVSNFLDNMPTRHLDMHLHMQVLKDSFYKPKISDLEDWSGLSMASCYCDYVVCEKHFAAMIKRDGYKSNAIVFTNFKDLLHHLNLS
jgi:hypothetical protein